MAMENKVKFFQCVHVLGDGGIHINKIRMCDLKGLYAKVLILQTPLVSPH